VFGNLLVVEQVIDGYLVGKMSGFEVLIGKEKGLIWGCKR
jgi:hypothetical protein